MIRRWLVLCLVLGAATISALPVVSEPAPGEVMFSKTVEAGTFTVEVGGKITFDPAARTVSGMITVLVKDGDMVIAERMIEFTNAAGATAVAQDIVVEEAGLTVSITVDPVSRSVSVSVEIIPGSASRRHPG